MIILSEHKHAVEDEVILEIFKHCSFQYEIVIVFYMSYIATAQTQLLVIKKS